MTTYYSNNNLFAYTVTSNSSYALDSSDYSIIADVFNRWDILVSPDSRFGENYQITVSMTIDALGAGILGGTSVSHVASIGSQSFGNTLPYTASITLNDSYVISMKSDVRDTGKTEYYYVLLHEVGHVLGIGTFWGHSGAPVVSYQEDGLTKYFYTGQHAVREYKRHLSPIANDIVGIPIEDNGSAGTVNVHPEEGNEGHVSQDKRYINGVFHPGLDTELMTGWMEGTPQSTPLSRITLGFLEDIGFNVNYNLADYYRPMTNWLDLSNNANCFKSIYEQGFVDLSGGSIQTRNDDQKLIIAGDASLNNAYLGEITTTIVDGTTLLDVNITGTDAGMISQHSSNEIVSYKDFLAISGDGKTYAIWHLGGGDRLYVYKDLGDGNGYTKIVDDFSFLSDNEGQVKLNYDGTKMLLTARDDLQSYGGNDNGGLAIILEYDPTKTTSNNDYTHSSGILPADYGPENWKIMGNAIFGIIHGYLGDINDNYNESISISDDGLTIAFGVYGGWEFASVYTWDGSAWALKGTVISELISVSNFGKFLSLSGDGNSIIVGSDDDKHFVFKWSGTAWEPQGGYIDITGGNNQRGQAINTDGTVIAVGDEGSGSSGTIKIFDINPSETNANHVGWTQRGNTITNNVSSAYIGRRICITSNGNMIATPIYSSSSQQNIYKYNSSNTTWENIPYDSNVPSNGQIKHVALSKLGTHIALIDDYTNKVQVHELAVDYIYEQIPAYSGHMSVGCDTYTPNAIDISGTMDICGNLFSSGDISANKTITHYENGKWLYDEYTETATGITSMTISVNDLGIGDKLFSTSIKTSPNTKYLIVMETNSPYKGYVFEYRTVSQSEWDTATDSDYSMRVVKRTTNYEASSKYLIQIAKDLSFGTEYQQLLSISDNLDVFCSISNVNTIYRYENDAWVEQVSFLYEVEIISTSIQKGTCMINSEGDWVIAQSTSPNDIYFYKKEDSTWAVYTWAITNTVQGNDINGETVKTFTGSGIFYTRVSRDFSTMLVACGHSTYLAVFLFALDLNKTGTSNDITNADYGPKYWKYKKLVYVNDGFSSSYSFRKFNGQINYNGTLIQIYDDHSSSATHLTVDSNLLTVDKSDYSITYNSAVDADAVRVLFQAYSGTEYYIDVYGSGSFHLRKVSDQAQVMAPTGMSGTVDYGIYAGWYHYGDALNSISNVAINTSSLIVISEYNSDAYTSQPVYEQIPQYKGGNLFVGNDCSANGVLTYGNLSIGNLNVSFSEDTNITQNQLILNKDNNNLNQMNGFKLHDSDPYEWNDISMPFTVGALITTRNVKCSNDGTTMAFAWNGTSTSRRVRVYNYNKVDKSWTQKGSDKSPDNNISSVTMNTVDKYGFGYQNGALGMDRENLNRIIVGGRGATDYKGFINIIEYINDEWTTVLYEQGTSSHEYLGTYRVGMSGNGNYAFAKGKENSTGNSPTKIYERAANGTWSVIATFTKANYSDLGNNFGSDAEMNYAGDMMVFCNYTDANALIYKNISGTWTKMGNKITSDTYPWACCLDKEGNQVALGSAHGTSGGLEIYEYSKTLTETDGTWERKYYIDQSIQNVGLSTLKFNNTGDLLISGTYSNPDNVMIYRKENNTWSNINTVSLDSDIYSFDLTENNDFYLNSGSISYHEYKQYLQKNEMVVPGNITIIDSSANNYGAYTVYTTKDASTRFSVGKSASNVFNIVNQNNAGVYMVSGNNSLTSTSDIRLKKEIEPLEDATERIMKLNPCTYKWKTQTDEKRHVGFIAQEVEEVFPELVRETTYPDGSTYKGVATEDLVGYLIKVMKNQENELNLLEEKMK